MAQPLVHGANKPEYSGSVWTKIKFTSQMITITLILSFEQCECEQIVDISEI
jgi:hypothetical protein